jgi:hypothetical protein
MFYVNKTPMLTQKSKLPCTQLSPAFNVFLEHSVVQSTATKMFSSPVMSNLPTGGFFYVSTMSNPLVPIAIYTRMPLNGRWQIPDGFRFIVVIMLIRHTKLHAFPVYILSVIYLQFIYCQWYTYSSGLNFAVRPRRWGNTHEMYCRISCRNTSLLRERVDMVW